MFPGAKEAICSPRNPEAQVRAAFDLGLDGASIFKIGQISRLANAGKIGRVTEGRIATERFLIGKKAGDLTTLYRAGQPSELLDIQRTGIFRNLGGAEGKYFTTSAESASFYAKQAVKGFGDPQYTLIQTQVPKSIFKGIYPATVDRGVPAWVNSQSTQLDKNPEVKKFNGTRCLYRSEI